MREEEPQPMLCSNGHPVLAAHQFCPECGVTLPPPPPTPPLTAGDYFVTSVTPRPTAPGPRRASSVPVVTIAGCVAVVVVVLTPLALLRHSAPRPAASVHTAPAAAPVAAAPGVATSAPTTAATIGASPTPSTPAGEHHVTGTVTVENFGADVLDSVAASSGYPDVDNMYDDVARTKARLAFLQAIQAGSTFDCSHGLGGGFDDMHAGAQVTVTDGNSNVIATSEITSGTLDVHGCHFTYGVDVPDADFYRITVSHRGELTYSRTDLESRGWQVEGSL